MPAADLAMQRKVPTRLIWMMRSKSASGKCLISPVALSRLAVLIALPVPAQLTSTRSWPMRGARLGEAGVDLLVAGDVDLAEHAAEFLRQRLAGGFVEVEQRDLDAVLGEAPRGGRPRPEAPPVMTAEIPLDSFMAEAYIVAAARTAGGKRGGRLSGWHPADLAAQVIDALRRARQRRPGAGGRRDHGLRAARSASRAAASAASAVLASKLPPSVPGVTIDRQCGSSQQALHFAAQAVMSGTHGLRHRRAASRACRACR